ncbi:methyltransferase domain-containing protein [Urechidicola vernalis]|uniref:Methyltransferase domain-containing protein n=1 Tax=Urechidicola vernalis TaxID=3075600 RepID=A0ABU2Y7J7_9FLAO|nr:methyltransferase domain-containing protein [Urechidicola sp. P050]MDT0554161.1 methyltransferase domain-containing protein [Urechidicola sp. P050]
MTELIDKLKADLDKVFEEETILKSGFYLKQYEWIHKNTSKLVGRNLLDWGAGYGHFSYIQSMLGKNVTALSPQEDDYTIYTKSLKSLSEKGKFECYFTDSPIKLPFRNNQFDIAVSCGVLEHVREFKGDDTSSLKELNRVLINSGFLVIAHLPNKYSWIEFISRLFNRQHHAFLYSKKEIISKINDSGFYVVKHKRYGFLPKNMMSKIILKISKNRIKKIEVLFYYFDNILSNLFPWFSQNHFLIVKKQ